MQRFAVIEQDGPRRCIEHLSSYLVAMEIPRSFPRSSGNLEREQHSYACAWL